MKNPNSIPAFFIIIALLFWNPLSEYMVFHDNPLYHSKMLHLIYWGMFILLLVCFSFVIRNRVKGKWLNVVFTISFSSLAMMLLTILDTALGAVLPRNETTVKMESQGIAFEPNTQANYRTTEFNVSAKINSIGIRDEEIPPKQKDKMRIVCIGDSWTFGWGVNAENSWPKQLQKIFQKEGNNIEVINCGQGGQYTGTYKKYLRRAIPVLQPDLILVGLLQIDDLAQLYENRKEVTSEKVRNSQKQSLTGIVYVSVEFFKELFKNTLKLIQHRKTKPAEVQTSWKESANQMLQNFNTLQLLNYHTYDSSLRAMFESGNLNPGMMAYLVDFWDRNLIFNDPKNEATIFAIHELEKDLKEMKETCDSAQITMNIISMPTAQFTGHHLVRSASNSLLDPYFHNHNHIDSMYGAVCKKIGIGFFEITDHFKALTDKNKYFFPFDGHPTEIGQEEIAKGIAMNLKSLHIIK